MTDLPRVANWIRGSYSAEEWPSDRRFSDGTVLLMDPNPKPELQIEQRQNQEETSYATGRRNKIVAALTLYEEDLRPLVEWLLELSSEFGVDLQSQHRRRIAALAQAGLKNQSASIPVEASTASSTQTYEPTELCPEPTDFLDNRAEDNSSINPLVTQSREVPKYPGHPPEYLGLEVTNQNRRRAEPEIRGGWLRWLSETTAEVLLTFAILVLVIWEFVMVYRPGIITDFISAIVLVGVIVNSDRITKYWRKFYVVAKSRLAPKQEQSEE